MKMLIPFLLVLFVSCSSPEGNETGQHLSVMSFNIRFDNPGDSLNWWNNRKELVVGTLQEKSPDLIGMQEVLDGQLNYLLENMPGYGSAGVARDDGKKAGEYSPLLYKKDLFEVIDWGTFWLSPTPGDTGSVGWDAALTRICTWARLKDLRDNREFFFLNTHFDHMGTLARKESAGLIINFIEEQARNLPVILTGDFNCTPDEEPYHVLTNPANGLKDACLIGGSGAFCGMGTFNGFGNADETERIDLILLKGDWRVGSFQLLKIKQEKMFISDHWPVLAEIIN
jgi:endonuclease/exonuclease/phosphatase family metal-dependent hydrolase